MSTALLDNIIWNSLVGSHARFSIGTDRARRYVEGFPALIAFADPTRPDFAALAPHCAAGEHFYCEGWSGEAPPGWAINVDATMLKMVWQGTVAVEDDATGAVALDPSHADRAMELVRLTMPGPFGTRSFDLGDYFGFFDGDRLIAMAGERFAAGGFREVSAVCTHPDHQGRGLARKLMHKLIRRQLDRGETPFLHVMSGNATARGLYERMGFAVYREQVVRVVSRGVLALPGRL